MQSSPIEAFNKVVIRKSKSIVAQVPVFILGLNYKNKFRNQFLTIKSPAILIFRTHTSYPWLHASSAMIQITGINQNLIKTYAVEYDCIKFLINEPASIR